MLFRSREELLRIPGIGYRTVARILSIRRYQWLRLEDLKKLRVFLRRARVFVITKDHHPDGPTLDALSLEQQIVGAPRQMDLFGGEISAVTGQL